MEKEHSQPLLAEVHRFENEKPGGKKIYQTEAGPIEVMWRKFEHGEKGERSGKTEKKLFARTAVFLPGSMMDAHAKSIEPIGQALADCTAGSSYTISARAERYSRKEDMFSHEADAIRQFVEEQGLADVVVAGYSQGGDRAIDLVDAFQKNNSQSIKGLVLFDSVGLYARDPNELSETSKKHSMLDIPPAVLNSSDRTAWERSKQAFTDMLFYVLKEMVRSKTGAPERFRGEVENMAKLNDRTKNIRVPVALVHGEEDPISDPKKIVPQELFPSSPYVRMVVAKAKKKKAGHHALPLIRPESVVRAAMYMLERYYRGKNDVE